MDSAERNDAKETAAGYQAGWALREAAFGNWEQARAEASAARKLAANRHVRAMSALGLALTGDAAAGDKLAAELDKTFPLDTLVQKNWLPRYKPFQRRRNITVYSRCIGFAYRCHADAV